MISAVILAVGMIGVFNGVIVSSQQNGMANRHTRASIIAQELTSAIESQTKARLIATSGLFGTACVAAVPTAITPFIGQLTPTPPSLTSQGFTAAKTCYVDFDASSFTNLTAGYSTSDGTTYKRAVAVYQHPTDPSIIYVGVNVGWRDAGRVRTVTRFTAIFDANTTLEY